MAITGDPLVGLVSPLCQRHHVGFEETQHQFTISVHPPPFHVTTLMRPSQDDTCILIQGASYEPASKSAIVSHLLPLKWSAWTALNGIRSPLRQSNFTRLPPAPKREIKQQNNGPKSWFKVPKGCPDLKGMVHTHF